MIYAGRLARSLVFWFASCLPLNYVVLRVLFFFATSGRMVVESMVVGGKIPCGILRRYKDDFAIQLAIYPVLFSSFLHPFLSSIPSSGGCLVISLDG